LTRESMFPASTALPPECKGLRLVRALSSSLSDRAL